VANPLDYHTYIWGDLDAQTACFTRMLSSGFDDHVLVLDVPRADRCDPRHWETTLAAFEAAHRATGGPSTVVSSLPEGLPEALGDRLTAAGIAPMRGMTAYVEAVRAAARVGAAQRGPRTGPAAPLPGRAVDRTRVRLLDEVASKAELRAAGVPVPEGRVVRTGQDAGPGAGDGAARDGWAGAASGVGEWAAAVAADIGFPVVAKAVSAALAHKTEAGAVRLGLRSTDEVRAAAAELAEVSAVSGGPGGDGGGAVLVEAMATDTVAELIVGVSMDERFGPALTVGSGGTLVELVRDSVTLLLPADRAAVRDALGRLRVSELLAGHRGGPPGDVDAAVDAVMAIAAYAGGNAGRLVELDVNPLLVRPRGVVAVDALIRFDDGEGAHG
jgi:acetyl-CoA synthetase